MAFTLTSRWKTQKTQHCYNQLTCARAHVRGSMQVPEVHTEWFLNHFPHYFVRQGLLTNLVLTDSVGFTGQWALGLPTPGWHHICFLHKYLESELGFSGLCSKSFINEVTSPATNFFFFLTTLFISLHTNECAGFIIHRKYSHTPWPEGPFHREPSN